MPIISLEQRTHHHHFHHRGSLAYYVKAAVLLLYEYVRCCCATTWLIWSCGPASQLLGRGELIVRITLNPWTKTGGERETGEEKVDQ